MSTILKKQKKKSGKALPHVMILNDAIDYMPNELMDLRLLDALHRAGNAHNKMLSIIEELREAL